MPSSMQVTTDRQRKESRWYPGANVETFAEAIQRRGLKDPGKRCIKPRLSTAKTPHAYPSDQNLQHWILIEAQGPHFTRYYDDDGVSGIVFSSPGLTDAYVKEYCRLNKLRS